MWARKWLLALAGALLAAACSKSESPPTPRPQANAPKAAPAPAVAAGQPGEIDEGLRERLARQEAAARMFESKVLNPPAPKVPDPPAAVKAATPPPPAQAPVAPRPAPTAAAVPAAGPQPLAPARAEPKAEPPKVAARSEPPKAAAARPSSTPEAAATKLLTRVDPDFPREATQAGVEQGNVRARMTLDAAGNVTRVEIVEANPRRVFDRAVVRALTQWRYSDGAAGRTVDIQVAFKR